jgi:hypothetical protein
MAVPNSTPISFAEIRAEGNKTSWVSPAYPTTGRLYNIDPNWMMSVDENNQIGLNPSDGSFSIAQMQGWDTWKRPVIEWVYPHQFTEDGGLRIAWKASGGDVFRCGWVILRSTSSFVSGSSSYSSYTCQYAGEQNPNESNKSLQYSSSLKVQALKGDRLWHSLGNFGDYHINTIEPASAALIDPTSGAVEPTAVFSWIQTTGLTVDGSTPHYVAVIPVDARQGDTLSDARSPGDFNLNRGGGTYNAATKKNASLDSNGWNYYDSDNGDGGIILFSEMGNPSFGEETDSSFEIDIQNAYRFYLGGQNFYFWVYVTEDQSDVSHPYYPTDSGIPSGHPYDDPPAGSLDYQQFELEKWTRFEGDPMVIAALTESTDYRVSVASYRANDINRYENSGVNNTDISGPSTARDVFGMDKGDVTVQITTEATGFDGDGSGGYITGLSIDSYTAGEFGLSWNHPLQTSADTYDVEYSYNGSAWEDATTSNEGNWSNTNAAKSCDAQPSVIGNLGDTFRFRVAVQTETNYNYSQNYEL